MKHRAPITEAAFTKQIIDLARWHGYRVAHFRAAQTQRGNWITPVQGDGKGYPDLTMVNSRKARLIFAELKTDTAPAPRNEQAAWISDLATVMDACGVWRVMVCLWRPEMIDDIEDILKHE